MTPANGEDLAMQTERQAPDQQPSSSLNPVPSSTTPALVAPGPSPSASNRTSLPSPSPLPPPPPQQTPQSPSAPPTGGIVALTPRPRGNFMATNKPSPNPSPNPNVTPTNANSLTDLLINKRVLSENDKAVYDIFRNQSGLIPGRVRGQLVRRVTPPSPLATSLVHSIHPNDRAVLAKPFKSPFKPDEPKQDSVSKEDETREEIEQEDRVQQAKQQQQQQLEREEEEIRHGLGLIIEAEQMQSGSVGAISTITSHEARADLRAPQGTAQHMRRPAIEQAHRFDERFDTSADTRQTRRDIYADQRRHTDLQGPHFQDRHHDDHSSGRLPPGAEADWHSDRQTYVPQGYREQGERAQYQRACDPRLRPDRSPGFARRAQGPPPDPPVDPFIDHDAPPKRHRDDEQFDPRELKRTRSKACQHEQQQEQHRQPPQQETSPMDEDEEEEEDTVPFDPTAAIEPYDYIKELQEPWNEMMGEMIPYLDEWAEKFLAESVDTVLTVYHCFHQMSVKQGQSLQDGVDEILAQQKWQNGRRQTFIDFRKQMAKVALALGDIDPEDEGDLPVSPAKKRRV